MSSELAQLMESIRSEYEASLSALKGPAIVGKHEFISARMTQLAPKELSLYQRSAEAGDLEAGIEFMYQMNQMYSYEKGVSKP